ncbi:hypothetical protein ACFYRN_45605 [Streptomyces sp. NPDC005227]|uniref:hypothetical protein n=1 Tax=Streptomyces sp. NPDC005227 TaxID=3364707 RepID=UPI003680B76D
MTASFQIPRVAKTPVSLAKKPVPQTVFVDRDGDEWLVTGHNGRGELVLSCPNPQNPGDQGVGESRAWTLHEVQTAFGPLMARTSVNAA